MQFPARGVPEKQVIRFQANIDSFRIARYHAKNHLSHLLRSFIFDDIDNSRIVIEIDYTELTWGVDVLNYIEKEVKKAIIVKINILQQLSNLCLPMMKMFSVPAIFFIPMLSYLVVVSDIKYNLRSKILDSIANITDVQSIINKKIDYVMVEYTELGVFNTIQFWMLTISCFVIFFATIAFFSQRSSSALLLNEATIRAHVAAKERRDRIRSSSALAFVLGVASSIAASHVEPIISAWL